MTISIASIIVIAFVYMVFDVFNRRNIPNTIVYASLVYAVLVALFYFNSGTLVSFIIAGAIGLAGYAVYKVGQIGAADVVEFAVLSLLMPYQVISYGIGESATMPFIFSLLINTGIAALIIVPLYYIPKGYSRVKGALKMISKADLAKAVVIGMTYIIFIGFLVIVVGIGFLQFLLLALIMLSSIAIVLFERLITRGMIEYVKPDKFDSGDIIALNLMKESDIRKVKSKVKSFERLVNEGMIKEMIRKRVSTKFPVYKEAMPLALAILIGAILALYFGNLLIFIIAPPFI
jgi:Flp pilus assembly protein protease CpaA